MKNNSKLFRECKTLLFSISDMFGIDNETLSIKEPVYFRIPKYQRSYVWEQGTYDFSTGNPVELKKNKKFKGQVEYFWEDLKNTINCEKHYTGLIGLKKMSLEEKIQEKIPKDKLGFYIIDGQQRFTTIMLLISLLNKNKKLENLLIDDEKNLLFDYTRDKKNFSSILRSILLNKHCDKKHNYKDKLSDAKKFFNKSLEIFTNDVELDKLTKALLNNMLFNVFFSLSEDEDSENIDISPEIIFESINNRGKELSKIDILKNRIFYLDKQKLIDKNIEFDIEDLWENIFDNLSNIENPYIKDDDYLLTHYYIFGNDSNIKIKTYILLQNILDIFQVSEKNNKINYTKYFKTLSDCSKFWLWINNSNCIDIDKLQEKIDKKEEKELKVIVSKLSHLIESNYIKSFLILLFYSYDYLKYIDINKLINIFKFIEKFAYIYQYLNYKNPDFPYIATKTKNLLYDEKGNIRDKDDFNQQLQLTINDLINIIKKILDKENFKLWANKMMAKDACFYSWNGIYYTLYELNNARSEDGKIEWKDIVANKSKTIEHIYPENPNGKNNDELSKRYWEEACPSAQLENKSKMIHSLGNLIPVSHSINASASNKLYPEKLKKYDYSSSLAKSLRDDYKTSIYWDVNLIKERTRKMLKTIQNTWLKNEQVCYSFKVEIDEEILEILTNYHKNKDSEYKINREEMGKIWNDFQSKDLCDEIYRTIRENRINIYNYKSTLFNKDYCKKTFNLNCPLLTNIKDSQYISIFRNKLFILNLEKLNNNIKDKILQFLKVNFKI